MRGPAVTDLQWESEYIGGTWLVSLAVSDRFRVVVRRRLDGVWRAAVDVCDRRLLLDADHATADEAARAAFGALAAIVCPVAAVCFDPPAIPVLP